MGVHKYNYEFNLIYIWNLKMYGKY